MKGIDIMASEKFITEKKYFNKDGKETTVYKGIKLEEIIDWLDENGSEEDKREFKKAFYTNKDGSANERGNFIRAKKMFFERHNPDYLPTGKSKIKDRMKNW